VLPRDKREVVEVLKSVYHRVVGMTGDGVNDAPALSAAQVGIGLYVHICMYRYLYICLYVYMYACMYIYVYIHVYNVYLNRYEYIYTYIKLSYKSP
jgi:hypothetical protein